MKRHTLRLTYAIIMLAISMTIHANTSLFKTIDNRLGLPDNSVYSIRQDDKGFIWMATYNGLCRYDGMFFYTLTHDANDPSSIMNNVVYKLGIAWHGLWAATSKGLDYLSFADGRFSRCTVTDYKGGKRVISSTVKSIIVNGEITLACDGKGTVFVHRKGMAGSEFRLAGHGVRAKALTPYRDGMVLGIYDDGVRIISPDGSKVITTYHCRIVTGQKTFAYYSHNTGLMYVGSGIGKPGMAFSIKGHSISPSATSVPYSLTDVTDYGRQTAFATDGGGVIMMGRDWSQTYTPMNTNISGDAIYSLFADRQGNLWAGTYRAGVNLMSMRTQWWDVLDKANGRLTYDIATAIVTDKEYLYIGLDGGGLNIYDRSNGTVKALTSKNSDIPGDNIVSMTKDDKFLYMASYTKGFVRMRLSDHDIKTFQMQPNANNTADNLWVVCDDGMGRIWIGGPDLSLYDKHTERITTIKSMKGTRVTSMMKRGRHIWISTTGNGIYKVDPKTCRTVSHYTASANSAVRLPSNDVKYMYVDSNNRVWVTSETSGFYTIDEKQKKLTPYGIANGLTSSMVVSITEDSDRHLWMGTSNGLFNYDPATDVFVRFDDGTSIPSSFTYASGRFSNDTMYIGSTNGLVMFDPRQARNSSTMPADFMSLQVTSGSKRTFNFFGGMTREVRLAPDENFFTVTFSVPDIAFPGRIHFSCRLDGLEKEWRDLAGRREASYTNVPPGHYKLYVRCTDGNGGWQKASVLEITVTPPWYATAWAKVLWTMFTAFAVTAVARLYMNQMKIKQEIRIAEIEKQTQHKLNDAKQNFYTNITHELRTPVFLIAAQIEELLDAKQSVVSVPSAYLQSIHRNAVRLNKLISHIIDFRKLESGKLMLMPVRGDVVSLCRELSDGYKNLCQQKDITFTFITNAERIMLDYDPDKTESIITNLVSNAFKYTKENGAIELSVTDEADRVTFAVKDNGIGIIEKMRGAIFKSFYRTERAVKQSGGDGLGLSFVKALVELHGGKISVESEVNVGSTFTFYIPKKHPDDQQDNQQEKVNDVEKAVLGNTATILPAIIGTDDTSSDMPANPTATHSVLIIDDERETVSLLERSLNNDYKVLKAYNGVEGLEVARASQPDIIVCDLMMPRMDGMDFLTTMKNDKQLQNIKIIIFTAKNSEEDMLKAYDAGADAYLMKPISMKLLRKRIDRMVEQTDNAMLTETIAENKKTYSKEEQIFLLRCREIIDENLTNEDFSIDLLADKLAMSHSSLYKKIKAMTGLSLINFINDYKIYKAVKMFNQGVSSVNRVCTECGFKDIKNFRKAFYKKTGKNPKQYVQEL